MDALITLIYISKYSNITSMQYIPNKAVNKIIYNTIAIEVLDRA